MAAKSWRLSFIDIDNSFSLSTGGTTLYSYIVVRAPKGEAEPKYFEKGNEEAIKAMVGLPTANWPDIYEAIAVNQEYDTYISCPAGSSKDYPTTYGGVYICKDGSYEFYNVTDAEEPNFLTATSISGDVTVTPNEVESTQDTVSFTISSSDFAKLSRLDFSFWGNDSAVKGLYKYNVNKTTKKLNPYVDDVINTNIVCGTITENNDTTFTITLGDTSATNTLESTGVPFIKIPEGYTNADVKATLKECLNIRSSCYGYIIQASPTETPTSINISDIGYDKYQYDTKVNWLAYAFENLPTDNTTALINNYVAFGLNSVQGIAKYDATTQTFTDVTSSFSTKSIAVMKKYTSSTTASINEIFYLENGTFTEKTVNGVGNAKLYENLAFNTFTFSCSEEVYPGKSTSGGTFTGSFSETGVDSYGASIYWTNIISDDAMSFVKVVPLKTMDSDVDGNGFFTGAKIVDSYAGIETVDLTLKGTRYLTSLVNENIEGGSLGCAWRGEFESILNEGLTEALNTKYWETSLFIECTGNSVFSEELAAIRNAQKLSTVIGPYTITQAILDNPDTAIVGGRTTGVAKYIGEFQMLDSQTGKKYWCQPIGDVGTNLLRIMDKKLGACSPYGTNDSSNCGGVLNRTVLKAKWDIGDTAQSAFDKKGLNPIVLDKSSGSLTIMSGKTLQDPNNITDWSWLSHSMAFDLCKRELYDNVMHPQLGKKNNSYWQKIRKEQIDAILEKRTTGNDPAWVKGIGICDDTVNTSAIKAARGFAIKVRVKVTTFSETVTLTFVNEAQSTVMA